MTHWSYMSRKKPLNINEDTGSMRRVPWNNAPWYGNAAFFFHSSVKMLLITTVWKGGHSLSVHLLPPFGCQLMPESSRVKICCSYQINLPYQNTARSSDKAAVVAGALWVTKLCYHHYGISGTVLLCQSPHVTRKPHKKSMKWQEMATNFAPSARSDYRSLEDT